MTDAHDKVEQSLLPVTQADRDAAQAAWDAIADDVNQWANISVGEQDHWVQAFARHRQSSNAAERGGVNDIFDIEPSVGAREPEPSLRRIVRAYYNGHFNAVRAEELTEAYFASLSTTPATAKRPWCETCGEGVAEVLCQTCAKWWHDNAPATAMDEIQRLGQEYDGEARVCSACDGESKGCTSEYRCLRCEGTGVEPDFVDGLDNRPKADDAAVARAARAALGGWLAWPDVARDGAVPFDNEQAISWLQGLPAKLTTPSTPDRIGKDAVREASIKLAYAAGALNAATDGQEAIRLKRQAVLDSLKDVAAALSATPAQPVDETERLREVIADPNAVHVNMLRGSIAKPSIAQFIHLYGEDAVRAALHPQEGEASRG